MPGMDEPANDDEQRELRSALLTPFRVVWTRPRLFVCLILGVAIGAFLPEHMRIATRALIAWNIAVLCYLASSANLIANADPQTVRERAKKFSTKAARPSFCSPSASPAPPWALLCWSSGQSRTWKAGRRRCISASPC